MILLSPAKTLKPLENTITPTIPRFEKDAMKHNGALKRLGKNQIKSTMKLSDALLKDTWSMIQNFASASGHPALFHYHGEVFKNLDVLSLTTDTLHKALQEIYLLSGMYGLLRASDLVKPYRLEMQYSLLKLVPYWKPKVTQAILHEVSLHNHSFVFDLLSEEYRKVLDLPLLQRQITWITLDFQTDGKSVSMHAKKARGLMARHILSLDNITLDNVKGITFDGYVFNEEKSSETYYLYEK